MVAAAIVVGAVVSLGRVPGGPGVLDTIWAEDGSDLLTDVLGRNPYLAIFRPLNGYFIVVPRILAIPAGLVPIGWAPTVLTIEAALATGAMAVAVYAASRALLRYRLASLIAAVPVLAAPAGENLAAAVANNVATLQFAAVYTTLWMVLWTPARRRTQIASVVVVAAVALSTFLAVVVLPLALVRLYARRDAVSAAIAASLGVALAANSLALATHLTGRPFATSRYDLGWAAVRVGDWALPHALFGYRVAGGAGQVVGARWLAWAALSIVVLIAALAAFGGTRPQWKLAAALGGTAVALVCGSIMEYGALELRYVVAPELMLFAALAAMLLPRPASPPPVQPLPPGRRGMVLPGPEPGADRLPGRSRWWAALRPGRRWKRVVAWAPLLALGAGLAMVLAGSYRTAGPRVDQASWRTTVAAARTACLDPHQGWVYVFPGDGHVVPFPAGTPIPERPPPAFPVLVPCPRLR